ncbi:LPXTG cell wall anchor domain-containing protein [Longispora albida]|uniref:LPXTG cell wall anchor domain-containing protein n=1 Tax=Longispora albida TaxID=203523 RepID=UPI00036096C6|nr:LPXTG cell wall anchor domain-containing protein [Longispora albida]
MRARIAPATAVLLILAAPAPAHAAPPLGGITLSAAGGSVTDNPMLASATTTAACPAGYGTNASIKVGRPGGPYSNLNKVGSAGGYDLAPFTLTANRSFTTANGGTPPAGGDYQIVIGCVSETAGDYPGWFTVDIAVTGTSWQVRQGGPQPTPSASPGGPSNQQTLRADVAPGTRTPAPATTTPPKSGTMPTTGRSLTWLIAAGLILAGAGAAARWAVRRRRAA